MNQILMRSRNSLRKITLILYFVKYFITLVKIGHFVSV
jgi:hypothetical protein